MTNAIKTENSRIWNLSRVVVLKNNKLNVDKDKPFSVSSRAEGDARSRRISKLPSRFNDLLM